MKPAAPTLRLPRWLRRLVDASALALLASGAAWLAIDNTIGPGAGALPHPAEAWLMKFHGAATLAATFALGSIAASHLPAGWRRTRSGCGRGQRASGIAMLALAALLVATGYALWYLVGEPWRAPLGWAHAALGFGAAIPVFVHRRARAASPSRGREAGR